MRTEQVLRGERLILRDYCSGDMPFGLSMWLDEENGRFLSDPTAECADERYFHTVERLADHPAGYFLVAEWNGTPVGSCFAYPDKAGQVYEIAYCVHKDHWRQGFGYEMVQLLIEWIRAQGAKCVEAEAAVENAASNALLRKCGFAWVGPAEFTKRGAAAPYKSNVYKLELK